MQIVFSDCILQNARKVRHTAVLSFPLTIPNLQFVQIFFLRPLEPAPNSCCTGATISKVVWTCAICFCEVCTQTFLLLQSVSLLIIKLTQDAPKEIVEINTCKYDSLVATHVNDMFRTNSTPMFLMKMNKQ